MRGTVSLGVSVNSLPSTLLRPLQEIPIAKTLVIPPGYQPNSANSNAYRAATTPAIANATIPPNACCVGTEAAPELAVLGAELLAAPALPVGEEPSLLLAALVVMEASDEEVLEDGDTLDDPVPVEEIDEGEEGEGEDGVEEGN